jgi:hypothetical protein
MVAAASVVRRPAATCPAAVWISHAGVGPFAEHGPGRADDGVDAAPGIGPAAAGRRGGFERVSHQAEDIRLTVTLTNRKS